MKHQLFYKMKNLAVLLCMVFAFVAVTNVHAQLSKAEAKEWKNKAKDMKKNPDALKAVYDENASLKADNEGYKRQISSLQSDLKTKSSTIDQMTENMKNLQSEADAAKKIAQDASKKPVTKGPVYDDSGIVFKVQVGAFRSKDLSKYFNNTENFGGETDDGVQKITLGRFRDYWESDTFKKYLREMGVKDAWIVPFKDGKRVAMKEVLEGVIK
jgi:hypothetical protein